MKKRLLSLLLILVLLVSCSGPSEQIGSSTDSDMLENNHTEQPTDQLLSIVQDGKTDYVIVFDNTDFMANTFVKYLQNSIYKKTGVLIPMRGVNLADQYEYRILVGDTRLTESNSLKQQNDKAEYSWLVSDKTIALYASDIYGYLQMESYVSSELLNSASSKTWSLTYGSQCGLSTLSETTFLKDSSTVYNLVYDSDVRENRAMAIQLASYITQSSGLKVNVVADTSTYQNEIWLGNVDRSGVSDLARYLTEGNDYIGGVFNGTYTILAESSFGIAMGTINLIETLNSVTSTTAKVTCLNNTHGNTETLLKDKTYAEAVDMANLMNGTYSTWIDKTISNMNDVKEDQALVEALIERMGNSVAVSVGSSNALYNGYIVKLDKNDYSKVTKVTDSGNILIAAEFANEYFGTTLSADADGYVDISTYCKQSEQYSLYYDKSLGMAIVTPSDVVSFSEETTVINGYRNSVYVKRMAAFFNNPEVPEPSSNVEQTRVVIDSVEYDTDYIIDYTTFEYNTFYSPAILSMVENGVTTLYVAYEDSTVLNGAEKATVTYLKKSVDNGKTWEQVGRVSELRWASLFELNGKVYLLGNSRAVGTVVIAIYDPATGSLQSRDLGLSVAGGAPNTVTVANGRVYKAYNDAVISASVTSDLTVKASWTVSNNPQDLITRAEYNEITGKTSNPNNIFWFEEGNVIATPDGSVYVMYRIDAAPTVGYVTLFKLSKDGTTLSVVEECRGIVKFPYTQSKFTIRYDETTGLYVSLTSLSTAKKESVYQRNVLGLVVSKDLINWEVVDVLLVDREMMNPTVSIYAHAFQYVDFVISGNNIYFVVREAVGDTIRFHDAKDMTFYTLYNYVDFINSRISTDSND